MMLRPRVIPCLLIKGRGLVKTVNFKQPKYVGDPINAVKIFNEKEADELIVLDIDATAEGRSPDFDRISHLALECRMPLCYGGGVKTVEQARQIVSLGVEKIAISAAAIENPQLISQMAEQIGAQSVVVVLDVRKSSKGHDVWIRNGTKNTGRTPQDVVEQVQALGAGEILINSIDRDGGMGGYDLDLAVDLKRSIRVPMTVLGGAGSLADMAQLVAACGVVGVAAGSLFVFKGAYKAVLINYPSAQNREALLGSSASQP